MNDVLDPKEPTIGNCSDMQSMHVKFERDGTFAILMMTVSFIFFLGAAAIYKEQFDRTMFIFVWSALWWYSILGMTFFLMTSELIVGERGLERKIFGGIYEKTAWGETKLVRELSKYSAFDKTSYCHIEIHTKDIPLFRFRFERTMRLSEEGASDFDGLVGILNRYISMHAIKVEALQNGQWQPAKRLVTSFT